MHPHWGRRGGLYNRGPETGSGAATPTLRKTSGTDVCAGNIHQRGPRSKVSGGGTALPLSANRRHPHLGPSVDNPPISGRSAVRNILASGSGHSYSATGDRIPFASSISSLVAAVRRSGATIHTPSRSDLQIKTLLPFQTSQIGLRSFLQMDTGRLSSYGIA